MPPTADKQVHKTRPGKFEPGGRGSVGGVNEVLVSLRRIIRAVDMHSKMLERDTGMTVAQVLVLRAVRELGEVTSSRISSHVTLSQGTLTTILDRLEARGLLERYRSTRDRRVVHVRLTELGRAALKQSPPLLQRRFLDSFIELAEPKQKRIVVALETVANMMGAGDLDAAPVLEVHALRAKQSGRTLYAPVPKRRTSEKSG